MNNTKILFENAWVFLLLIPAIIIAFIPFLKLNKQSRRSKNRIPSMIIHIVVLLLITTVFSGFKIQKDNVISDENTLLLVDVSDSSSNSKYKIDNYVESILENYDYDKNVGIIVFGNECEYIAKLSSNASKVLEEYKEYENESIKKDATNIEEALYYAQSILGENGGRIVILTDGIETDGDAAITASRLINENIQIDAVYFNNDPIINEIQINSLEVETPVSIGKEVNINVEIESKSNCIVKICLYDNNTLIGEKEVFVKDKGLRSTFIHKFEKGGEHCLKATIETESDTYIENNQYYSFINILDDTRILIVDGTGTESSKLYNLIKEDYEVVRTQASTVSSDLNDLNKYSEIILMNASMKNLPDNFDDVLKDYVAAGGNVLTTGGQNTYYYGDMLGTSFEDILPIEIEKDTNEPVGVMIVIDASGSMEDTWSGTSKKIDVAIQAAKESVNALSDKDYVGVIAFNSSANVIVPMTPCSQRKSIISKIEGIKTATGTYYGPALDAAGDELIPFNKTDIKHIIFASDGEPVDTNTRYFDLVSSMYEDGITTSTVAIDPTFDSDILQRVATFGGGNFHSVTDASKLDDIMIEEVSSLQGEYYNEGEVTPRINRYTSAVQGINSLPSINGYLGSSAKAKATVVLKANNDPLYAQWTYEKGNTSGGKVGSFMSDLSGNWTKEFMEDERGIKFIKNVITDLLSTTTIRTDMNVQFLRDNYKNIIEVKTPAVTGLGTVKANITYPNNETKTVDLKLTAANTYSAEIPNYGEEGLYKINIVKTIGSRETIEYSFTTFSYSMEYDAFYDNDENYEFINKLCKNSKGIVYTLDDDIFSNEIMLRTEIINPQIMLLTIALLLFLLDIIVRKFNFKWIYDILKKRSKKEG